MDWFGDFYNSYKLTYSEAFAYRYVCQACIFSLMGMTSAFFFGMSSFLVKATATKASIKRASSTNSVDTESIYFNLNSSYNDAQTFLKEDRATQKRSCWQIFLDVITFLSAWCAFFCLAITPSILSGLGVIPVWSSIVITLFMFAIMYMIHVFWFCPTFLRKARSTHQSRRNALWRKISLTTRLYKVRFAIFFIFAFIYSFAVPLMTANTCMNFFNEGYGTQFEDYGISTKFSRYFQLETVCPLGQICHVYATLPEDSATGVILNVHTGTDINTITIGYSFQSDPQQPVTKNATAQSFYVDLEERGARYVHSAVLSNLEPNTTYYFEIYYQNKMQRNGTYLTLPSEKMERNILIAAGGDAGTTTHAKKMSSTLHQNPTLDAIMVGGDLAYDNGMPSCYYSFDLFLGMFEDVNNHLGRIIPLFFSVGNHDLGFNAFQDTEIDITKNLYYTYFPQQTKTSADGNYLQVPELRERTSYYYHTLGNTVHLSLDSGYMQRYDGIQEKFIKNVSETYLDRVKMANYHVPMHPTCFDLGNEDIRVLTDPAKYWAPLFEQYKFASVFENHVHLYKKTFPIANGVAQPEGQGVVYFGDGNWGISPWTCKSWNVTGLLEAYSHENHVWLINITQDIISHYAINRDGQIFDKIYNMNVQNYIKS